MSDHGHTLGDGAGFLCPDLAPGITAEITYVDGGYNTLGVTGGE